jgi:hypothetical protein
MRTISLQSTVSFQYARLNIISYPLVHPFRKLQVVTLRFQQFIEVLRLSDCRRSSGKRTSSKILCNICRWDYILDTDQRNVRYAKTHLRRHQE